MTPYEIAHAIRGLLAVSAMIAASGAVAVHAQEQPGNPAGGNIETVVVTGSMIKRTDFDTPSPVQVVTAEDLRQSGYTSVSEVLRNIAANGQGTLSQSFGLAFAGGGAGVALRGLTVGGTLTLIDGSRMIPYPLSDDGQRNFVDVSQIPFNVIDRVDVLKDGASAAYGSDAVAGVVNVVLKKSFTGFNVSAEGGAPGHTGGVTEHLGALGGIGDLASDGYNAYLALEYRHQDRILLSDRSGFWTNENFLPYGGFDTRYGSPNSSPATALFPQVLGGYVLNPATGVLDATTHFLNPGACASYAAYQAGQCIYSPLFQVQPQTGNLNALGRFTRDLGGEWQGIVTASLFRSESEQVGSLNNNSYPFLDGLNPTTIVSYAPGVNPTSVTTPPILLPVGAPNNPFNAPAPLVADFPQLGMAQTQFVANTYRLFGDIRGTAAGFDIDGSAGLMYSALAQKFFGSISPSALRAAANSGFNFATASPAALAAAVAPEMETKDTNTMQIADVHAARQLAQLPGGPLSMAIGVGFYHLYKNSPSAPGIAGGLQFGNGAYAVGGQTNDNAYLELVAPAWKGLELDGAVRYDHYNQYGGSTTPKFGLKYTPFRMLTLRGTYGKGFRAPNPAESGKSAALFGGAPFNDNVLCPDPANPNAVGNFPSQCNLGLVGLQVSAPKLHPEKSTNYTFGLIFSPLESTKVSLDYWDIKVNQDIQSGVNVLFLGGDPALFPIVRGPQQVLPLVTAPGVLTPTPTPQGPVLYQAFPYFNLTQTHVNGLDLNFASHFDVGGAGRITAALNASHMFHYIFGLQGGQLDLAGTHGPIIISGDTGNPKDRATASLGWDRGPVAVSASLNYVGHFNVTDPSIGITDCPTAIATGGLGGPQATRFASPAAVPAGLLGYCDVKAFTDVDLYAQYAFSKHLSVHAAILNVFDSQPPVDLETYGASGNDPYNPAMHQAGAIGRFYNLGASYTF